MRFTDKVVLVTGAASGMGVYEAKAFAKEGARLRLHELSGIMALSQRRGCHHGEITASA